MKRRVVVTGIGCVTPVGNDVATTWDSLLAGRSGGAPITQFDTTAFKVKFACEVKNFDPQQYMDRKEVKRTDRYSQLAMAAAVQAMADAFPDGTGYSQETTGVVIGSGIGGISTFEEQLDVYKRLGPSKISAFFVPMFIGDIASGVVSMRFHAKGPNYAVQSACATSGHAIGDSFRMIQYGDADVMICGGSEASVSPMETARAASFALAEAVTLVDPAVPTSEAARHGPPSTLASSATSRAGPGGKSAGTGTSAANAPDASVVTVATVSSRSPARRWSVSSTPSGRWAPTTVIGLPGIASEVTVTSASPA